MECKQDRRRRQSQTSHSLSLVMHSLKSPCELKRLEKGFISTWGPSDAAWAVRIDFNFYFLLLSISFTLGVQKYKRKK